MTMNLPFPPQINPFKKLLGLEQLGAKVSQLAQTMEQPYFIVSDYYMTTAELAFYVEGQPRTYCMRFGRRMNQYDVWGGLNDLKGQNAVFVSGKPTPKDLADAFVRIEAHPIDIHDFYGNTIKTFIVCRCYEFKGWTPTSPSTY